MHMTQPGLAVVEVAAGERNAALTDHLHDPV
ncbi:hypothetical protein ACQEV9_45680 [Streptomyces chartreusis]